MLKIFIAVISFLLMPCLILAQQGKDNAAAINAPLSIINTYTPLTIDVASGSTLFSVGSVAGINPGDLIMIIQMQGASIMNTADNNWGSVSNYNNSGQYEFQEVLQVNAANKTITFSCPLQQNYTASGKVQIIKVPRYTTLTIQQNASITSAPWDGTTGGVVVAEVSGNVVLNGSISAEGLGFRSGIVDQLTSNGCIGFASFSPNDGAEKGEGIAGFTAEYLNYGGQYGRGAPANGGGGGNCHNGGGGGGANAGVGTYTGNGNPDNTVAAWTTAWNLEFAGFAASTSSGGGRGGYTFGSNDENALTLGPGNLAFGGDSRRNMGGKGGRPLNYATGRLFLGGGGGAGDANNDAGGEGGAGGGMVFLTVCGTVSGAGTIVANGSPGKNTRDNGNDAPGGGGGGGTVVINADGGVSGISISANGGKGGSQIISGNENEGPGGGGGGGYIAISSGAPTRIANGEANGTTNSNAVTEFIPNGATKGGAGIANALFAKPVYSLLTVNDTICIGNPATLNASFQGNAPLNSTINWYSSRLKTSFIAAGNSLTTPPLFKDTVFYVGACPYSCSTALIPVYVIVNPNPVAYAGNDTTVCSGVSFTRGVAAKTGTTYLWTPAAGLTTATSAMPIFKANNTSTLPVSTSYKLTVTAKGCSITDDVIITVNPIPVAWAGRDTSVCSNAPVTLGEAAKAGYNYTWTPAIGLNNATVSSPVFQITNTTAAPFTRSYTLTVQALGCSATDNVSVIVKPYPIVFAGNDTAVCTGISAQLGTASKPGYTYSWLPSTNLNNSAISAPVFTMTNATASPIANTLTVTVSSLGCSLTDQVIVTVNPKPLANAGNDTTVCPDVAVKLGSTSNGGYTYSWTPATGLSSANISNPVMQSVNTGTTTINLEYFVKVTSLGCTNKDTVIVNVNPYPKANAGLSDTLCPGNQAQLGVAAITGYTYSWNPSVGLNDVSLANPLFTGVNTSNLPVSNTFTLTVTSKGCVATSDVSIITDPMPKANAGRDTVVCSLVPVQLGSAWQQNYIYSWTGTTSVSPANISNPSVTLANTSNIPQTYFFYLKTKLFSCIDNDTVKVIINPIPLAKAGSDVSVCSAIPYPVGAPAMGGYQYQWTPALPGGNVAEDNITTLNTGTVPLKQRYILMTTFFNCTNKDTVDVTINPYPIAEAGPDQTVCSKIPATLQGNSGAGYRYKWTPALYLNRDTIASPVFLAPNTTGSTLTYIYSLAVTALGCTSKDSVLVTVNPYPKAVAGTDTIVCEKTTRRLGAPAVSGNTYSWSPATNLDNITSANPFATLQNNGSTIVTFIYVVNVTSKGCPRADTVQIKVFPTLRTSITKSLATCKNEPVELTAEGGARYLWSNGQKTPTITVKPVKTQYYYVSIENVCKARDSVQVIVKDEDSNAGVFIPNAFTPDGDGLNDVFKVEGTYISNLKAFIFNRWGELIYQWEGLSGGWDGSLNGTIVKHDVYVYLISTESDCKEKHKYNGTVTIVK